MRCPVRDVPGGVYKLAPAGDGCSDELCKGPFSQPSPIYAGTGCFIEIEGNRLRKEVMA